MSRARRVASHPIGQRVRVIGSRSVNSPTIGRTGTVMTQVKRVYGIINTNAKKGRWSGQHVMLDGPNRPEPLLPPYGNVKEPTEFWPSPDHLEPIEDYDGRSAGDWDECSWRPAAIKA